MSTSLESSTDGKLHTLKYNGSVFELVIENKPFFIADQPIKASLVYNGKVICRLPVIPSEDTGALNLFHFVYKMVKLGIVRIMDNAHFDPFQTMLMGIGSVNNDRYRYQLQSSYEDEDECEHRVYYPMPFNDGRNTAIIKRGLTTYDVQQAVALPVHQMRVVKLSLVAQVRYPITPGYIIGSTDIFFYIKDTELVPSPEELLKRYWDQIDPIII